jgi:FkbM family methyltransferase
MTTATYEHHPVIRAYTPKPVVQPPEFNVDFLGTRTRVEFEVGMIPGYVPPSEAREVTPGLPGFNEEYFEWIDVLEAVAEAGPAMVMVELGAGYGRWLMRGAKAAIHRGCAFHGVGVEAEPDHFRWMCRHFRDNGIDPKSLDLIWGAIGAQPGFVPFWVGDSDAWYGQAVAHRAASARPDARTRRELRARSALGRPPALAKTGQTVIWVPCVTVADLLMPHPRVDLMDLDVQGLELEVIASAMELMDARVRRVHIGTHSAQVEEGLRALFQERGWRNINDYPCQKRVETPYGEIDFGDGVQTWLNPALSPTAAPVSHLRREQSPVVSPPVVKPLSTTGDAVASHLPLETAGTLSDESVAPPERAPDSDTVSALKERYRALRTKYDQVRAERDALREKLRALKSKSPGSETSR